MSPLLIKISKDFATIWTTIDPIGNVAIFAGLTASLTRAERRRTALRATVILVVAVVAGQIVLDAIGIHLHSLKVAGGIILFLFGLQMLFGRMDAKPGAPRSCSPGNCNAEPRLLFYFFLGDFMTPSAMHSHLPLRSIQVSTQT